MITINKSVTEKNITTFGQLRTEDSFAVAHLLYVKRAEFRVLEGDLWNNETCCVFNAVRVTDGHFFQFEQKQEVTPRDVEIILGKR